MAKISVNDKILIENLIENVKMGLEEAVK